jgi:hypothetical protein
MRKRSRWWLFKFSNAALTFKKCGPPEKRDEHCHVLANSCWKMLLNAVGQLLGSTKRV